MAHGGGCECGGVRYEIRGAMRPVVVCHCGRCRRTHGDAAGYTSCAASDLALVEGQELTFHPNISFRGPQALWVSAGR